MSSKQTTAELAYLTRALTSMIHGGPVLADRTARGPWSV